MHNLVQGDFGGPGRPDAAGSLVDFPWHYCPVCGRTVSGGAMRCQHCATISPSQSQESDVPAERQGARMVSQADSIMLAFKQERLPLLSWLALTVTGISLLFFVISDATRRPEQVDRIDVAATVQAAVATAIVAERAHQAAVATAVTAELAKLPSTPAAAAAGTALPADMPFPESERVAWNGGPDTLPNGSVVHRGTIKNYEANWALTGLELYVEILDQDRNLIRRDRARIRWEGRLGPGQQAAWEYPEPKDLKPGEYVSVGPLRWDWVPAY